MGALHTKVWINPFMCVYVHPSLHCIVYKGVKVKYILKISQLKYILKISQQDVSFFVYLLLGGPQDYTNHYQPTIR